MLKFVFVHIFLPLLWSAVMLCGDVSAKPQTLASLKAAYVYNLAKFTRWPDVSWDSPSSPFQLCLYGDGKITAELEKLDNRMLGKHPIRVKKPVTEEAFAQCHLLYISATERRRYRYLLSLIHRNSVLTISNDGHFLRHGGLVNLIEQAQRLHFEVNMEQLSRSELNLSSKLLKLAILVNNPR